MKERAVDELSLDKLEPSSAPGGAQQQPLGRGTDMPSKRKAGRRRSDESGQAHEENHPDSEHQVDRLA